MSRVPTINFRLDRKTVLNNILAMLSGSAIAQGLTALTLLLTSRQIGPDGYGEYAGSLAFVTFTSIVFSLGLDMWLLYRAGSQPTKLSQISGSVLALKIGIGSIWAVSLLIITNYLDASTFPPIVMRLAILIVWFDNIFGTLLASFEASLRNQITSSLMVGSDLLWFTMTIILISRNETHVSIFAGVRVSILLISLLVAWSIAHKVYRPIPHIKTIKLALHQIFPYASSAFLAMAFMRIDLLIVAFALGKNSVGLYAPAVSVVNSLFILQTSVYEVMMPILGYLFATDLHQAWKVAKRSIWMQAFLGAGTALALALGSGFLVSLLGARFAETKEILKILSWIVFFHSISYAMSTILIAVNQQSRRTFVQFIAVIINVVLNLVVVNWAGIRGVAYIYVLSEIVLMIGYTTLVLKYRAKNKPSLTADNILLINAHSFHNAGDAALIQVALQQLRLNFQNSYITIVMNDPQSGPDKEHILGSFFTYVQENKKWKLNRLAWLLPASIIPILTNLLFGITFWGLTPKELRSLLKAYLSADLVVSIPGGFFYSSGRGMTLLITSFTLGLAFLAGKPLYTFPQSYGPLKRKWERMIANWIFTRARLVMVRESISLEELKACGIPGTRCRLLPDMAFSFSGASHQAATKWLSYHGIHRSIDQPLLGITVIDWNTQSHTFKGQERYEKAVAAAIRYFLKQYNGKAIILPQCWGPANEDDRVPSRKVTARIADLGNLVLMIENPLPPDLLKTVIGQMDLFIGTRMHSNIFALSQGVPVIPIGYLHKTQGIAQAINIDRWVLDIQTLDDEQLIDQLDQLWKERNSIRAHLEKTMPNLIQQSYQAGQLLAEDFARLREGPSHA